MDDRRSNKTREVVKSLDHDCGDDLVFMLLVAMLDFIQPVSWVGCINAKCHKHNARSERSVLKCHQFQGSAPCTPLGAMSPDPHFSTHSVVYIQYVLTKWQNSATES